MAACRAARSALSADRMASFTCASRDDPHEFVPRRSRLRSLDLLQIDPDGAAAGEPDLPGGLVGDPELDRPGLAVRDHIERLGHHGTLDAAARDRAQEIALVIYDQVGAD